MLRVSIGMNIGECGRSLELNIGVRARPDVNPEG